MATNISHMYNINYYCSLGARCTIEITQGPQNITVEEGESAVFTCLYTGTFDFPTWHINGATYVIQGETLGLPDRHRYSNQMMTVSKVQISDNETTYRCSFMFGEISSSTATLTVLPATNGKLAFVNKYSYIIDHILPVSDNFTEASSTTNPTSLATNIDFTTTTVTSPSVTSGTSQELVIVIIVCTCDAF